MDGGTAATKRQRIRGEEAEQLTSKAKLDSDCFGLTRSGSKDGDFEFVDRDRDAPTERVNAKAES